VFEEKRCFLYFFLKKQTNQGREYLQYSNKEFNFGIYLGDSVP
jgi:hypothetical protein